MKRGRPVYSQVRLNMVEILNCMGRGYGYDLAKVYLELFPKVTKRLLYYHLKKGVELGEFKIDKVEKEKGEYSWGSIAEKVYYRLGDKAEPHGNRRVIEFIRKRG